ncbi:hypothetical protein AX15_006468 [Amanita polypyramis BW_CC]|nr:hypothetical protein AX15_006468 [Amanita polypyramis BW_CC]
MPMYDLGDAPHYHSRKPSSKSAIIPNRKSSATLRKPLSLDAADDANDAANGRSLAHELAVALMPEPSASSKLLAEELGLEFDEGAEGIDEPVGHRINESGSQGGEPDGLTFASEMTGGTETLESSLASDASGDDGHPPELDPEFDNLPPVQDVQKEQKRLDQDMMEILARDLESNTQLFALLQKLDPEFTVERIASDTIRRINETVRDREGQVRELLEYEREFRKIAGEVGGSDALSRIDVLENIINEDESSVPKSPLPQSAARRPALETLEEEPSFLPVSDSQDWEVDPDRNHLGDDEEMLEADTTISKLDFPPPPPLKGSLTPAKTIPQLAHLRTLTSSLVSSLATCSEQAQVNGAGLTDAARKIRSLKNKISGLYLEWDSIERSKQRIERWEAGVADGSDANARGSSTSVLGYKRVDGRKLVQEHLRAFELALADASVKTQTIVAIMAR